MRCYVCYWYVLVKVNQSHYMLGQALRYPGVWAYQISRHLAHEGGKFVSSTHRPSLPPRKFDILFRDDIFGMCINYLISVLSCNKFIVKDTYRQDSLYLRQQGFGIRGYFSKPEGVREQKSLRNPFRNTAIPRLTTIIRSGITFVSRNLR